MTFPFDTTTLKINKPDEFSQLDSKYTLVRYVLPFEWAKRRGKNTYPALYIQLREQLTVPYLVFQHDSIDVRKQRVIYALYPKPIESSQIVDLEFEFLSSTENPLQYSIINFNQLTLRNIVKLLQSQFSNSYPYFAGNGRYYVHSPQKKKSKLYKCVEIEIKGASANENNEGNELTEQEFLIISHSKHFKAIKGKVSELTDNNKKYNAYFKIRLQDDGQAIFTQLKPSEIASYNKVYELFEHSKIKPRIKYHSQDNKSINSCRGLVLFEFIQEFQDWLLQHGIQSQKKTRLWKQHQLDRTDKSLKIEKFDKIFVYDIRKNQSRHQTDAYLNMLSEFKPDIEWVAILDLSEANGFPTLVLQDTNKADYDGGHLDGEKDAYTEIKNQYRNTPTQFINVNPNRPKDAETRSGYLAYGLLDLTTKSLQNKFNVSIFQLYLKDLIFNNRPVSEYLPITGIMQNLTNYAFIRKQDKFHNPVLLQVFNNQLQFTHLDKDGWDVLDELCNNFGYSWDTVEDNLRIKYFKDDYQNRDKKLYSYDLILMPNMAVEIEELDETVLYKYDIIQARLDARTTARPLSDLQLEVHFNKLKAKGSDEQGTSKLYDQIVEYDDWLLNDVRQMRISLEDLRSDYEDEIGEIFGWQVEAKKKLLKLYTKAWKLQSPTKRDVILHKGIFYDQSDNAYRVGSPKGINMGKQDTVFRIRRFDVIYGDSTQFDLSIMKSLLESMSVQFVRHNQYTVYPYFFALLKMYIDERL